MDDLFASLNEAPNLCWGSQMQGTSLFCTPGFRVGQAHFKNKVRLKRFLFSRDPVRLTPVCASCRCAGTADGMAC